MCTVTYLPLSNGSFILTSNRDEHSTRPDAVYPESYTIDGQILLYPKDPLRGGTWIAASGRGKVLCLLNGAFKKHIPEASYAISRGQIITDYIRYEHAIDFVNDYSFKGIEPFTLLIAEDGQLFEIRWNGIHPTLSKPSASKPHIWSSVTLYNEHTISMREAWFDQWIQAQQGTFRNKDIIHFHHFGGEGNQYNDLMMSRESGMGTVSITSILFTKEKAEMYYKDIKQNRIDTKHLYVKKRTAADGLHV